jgi:hypothetical protein
LDGREIGPESPQSDTNEQNNESNETSSDDSWDEDDFPPPEVNMELVNESIVKKITDELTKKVSENPGVLKCPQCPVIRATQIGITGHTLREHDPSNPFRCTLDITICKARFTSAALLRNHLKYHYIGFNNAEETSTECVVCLQHYKTRESLMKHVKRHLDTDEVMMQSTEEIEYYQCDHCEKKWPKHQKVNLRQHIMKVHMKQSKMRALMKRRSRLDPTGKVICYICSEYVTPSSLKQHIFNRHEKKSQYVCDIEGCDACFLYPSGLQKHKEFHQGIKKLDCEYCGKR